MEDPASCPLIITRRGKIISKKMYDFDSLMNAPLQAQKYFMNKQDWDDIVKCGR